MNARPTRPGGEAATRHEARQRVFFSIITRQAIRRGSYRSVPELIAAIRRYIDGWNTRCQPFVWTRPADDILTHTTRRRTSDEGHW